MDNSKTYEFFQPEKLNGRVHIIGCGSVGSTVVENLARFGITKMSLYDFDRVEKHNIANQMFVEKDIGRLKTEACCDIVTSINPEAIQDIKLYSDGYTNQRLSGYVFLCVDNIDLRRKIVEENLNNPAIKGMFDIRTGLIDAQHYAADWKDMESKQNLLNSMQFTHEDAAKHAVMSACHVELSVCPCIRIIVGYAVMNFINFAKRGEIKKYIDINIDLLECESF